MLAEVPTSEIVTTSLVLLGLLILGWFVVAQVRRRLQRQEEGLKPAGFTLSDLRQMHKTGQISAEEFERAKEKVLEAARRANERQEARKQETKRPGDDATPGGPGV